MTRNDDDLNSLSHEFLRRHRQYTTADIEPETLLRLLLATEDDLQAAVALMESEHPQRPQPGDFVAGVVLTAEGDTIFRIGTWPGKGEYVPQEEPTP